MQRTVEQRSWRGAPAGARSVSDSARAVEDERRGAGRRAGPAAAALAVLRFYKRWISPLLPAACRFHPTCSEYMILSIEKHGLLRGAGLGLRRLGRCHPFHEGGFDPVR